MAQSKYDLRFDLLLLGSGLGLSIIYLLGDERGWFTSAAGNLLANLAAGLVSLWLTVRIFDAMLRRRQEQRGFRERIVGNLNFTLDRIQAIPPHFDSERITAVANEVMWFNEKTTQGPTVGELKRAFSGVEIASIHEVMGRAASIVDHARLARGALHNLHSVFLSATTYLLPDPLREKFAALERIESIAACRAATESLTALHQDLARMDDPSLRAHGEKLIVLASPWLAALQIVLKDIEQFASTLKDLRGQIVGD